MVKYIFKPHIAKIVKEKSGACMGIATPHTVFTRHSPYHMFRSLSNDLKGRKFKNEEDLKRYLQDFFDSKPEEFYASGTGERPRHWGKVIDTYEEYIYIPEDPTFRTGI